MVKRYYTQDYPEYSGTFRSITQSNNSRHPEGKEKQSAKLETNSVLGIRNKRLER